VFPAPSEFPAGGEPSVSWGFRPDGSW